MSQPRQLSRLFIPPSLNSQQPMAFGEGAPLFSPALPSSIQQGMLPPFAFGPTNLGPMQTPMQPNFFPQPPGAPGRPTMHRSHPSVAQLAAAGVFPHGMPMTPLGQNGFPQPMFGAMPNFQMPPPRSKRSSSVSVGGPPKAVLGGPQRKVSPMPAAPATAASPANVPPKPKKVVVNFPRETIPGEGDAPPTRQTWARTPLQPSQVPEALDVPPVDITTADPYPPDGWRYHLPNTVDVFLPGKSSWDAIKQRIIEEKLEKLGVERGSGSSVPHILAPHARAASISSPADPALLYFKLNKLQQSQNASQSTSLSVSPQLPLSLSPLSPGQLPPRLQNRHGHSVSLAQPPSFHPHSPIYNPAAAFNPFGPGATLGSDQIVNPRISPTPGVPATTENIHAPQGRAPANFATLAPPQPSSRPESRPDFMRGFGLDVTEEVEEPEEETHVRVEVLDDAGVATDAQGDTTLDDLDDLDQDGVSTVAASRIHSRHVSRISAALSLRSVGGMMEPLALTAKAEVVPLRDAVGDIEVDDVDRDAVEEWTGSEDHHETETSDDESIGEWSNPSDEERARHQRLQRRMLRRAKQQDLETPRRLPEFPPGAFAPGADDDVDNTLGQETYLGVGQEEYYARPASNLSGKGRPLPPLPASRPGSAPYSYHDPALAHSREASEQYSAPGGLQPRPVQSASARRDSLNPLAKPFVFGASSRQASVSSSSFGQVPPLVPVPTPASTFSHMRAPSFGKPLNAAAQEFKPLGFTFRPPPGVPQLAFSPQPPSIPRPLPTPPAILEPSPNRASQGREKRQRRTSSLSLDGEDDDGTNTMSSFKFPGDATKATRHSAPASPPPSSGFGTTFNANAKPFTFSGFSALTMNSQQSAPRGMLADGNEENQPPVVQSPVQDPAEPGGAHELPFPPTSKPRRAPIPLDFKHPVSTNTVPAGLFKALVGGDGDERTRRAVRSRLSSRDIFEHSPRPSLDDLNVPPISHRKGHMYAEPGLRESSPRRGDIFGAERRRSSLPPRHHRGDSSISDVSFAPVNLSRRIEMQQYEQRLEDLLDEKFEMLTQELENMKESEGRPSLDSQSRAMISDVVSLFRSQLQESAAKGLEESQNDARGELDFELLKSLLEQSHAETRALLQRDILELMNSQQHDAQFGRLADDVSNRTVNAVVAATSQLAMRIQAMENSRPSASLERDTIVRDFMNVLMPQLAALRPEPIDYEGLTGQLTQAVKPHISQLIDLASDKRETASLIVDKLVPMLPALHPMPEFDTETIVGRLTTEVRKIVAPLDAHEIKEQVSDLVVERLDSRLAVQSGENVRGLLTPLQDLRAAVDLLGQRGSTPVLSKLDLSSVREDIQNVFSDLPERLVAATEALNAAQAELKSKGDNSKENVQLAKVVQRIESKISDVMREQQKAVSQNQEFSDFCQDIVKHIDTLPEAMVEATQILQNAHADFSARDTAQKDSEEIRKLANSNAELQVQLAKARGAHGQIRVEKEMLMERFKDTEVERDQLRTKVEELQATVSTKTAESAAEAKNVELEEALSRALERLKAADVQTQTDHERISQLEKAKHDLAMEKHQLKSQVDSLDMRVIFITREKENIADDLASQRKMNEDILANQSHWEELRRASEQIQLLTSLVGQADNEEIHELRRIRDRSRMLEGEHSAQQRRIKELEAKMANHEKVTQASRQSLSQAQQRAIEWEKRAKEYESELQATQSKLDDAETTQTQLDADYSLVKLQLEERDAEERLDRDRQSKLRDQIAALEAQVARLQAETDQAKKAVTTAPTARYQNGHSHAQTHPPPRPDSRASTMYDDSRAGTPTAPAYNLASTRYTNSMRAPAPRVATPPQPSVWDSIHAPRHSAPLRIPMTPKAKQPPQYFRPQIPSPTPSNVSAAPTLRDDGWWE
ncbi:hypothetical protein B0H21DRAFT_728360 [Amylocystis lapponica]|nr:hypothetical protein B0H21DRAFT_728360 [Amylocystis lapponica]